MIADVAPRLLCLLRLRRERRHAAISADDFRISSADERRRRGAWWTVRPSRVGQSVTAPSSARDDANGAQGSHFKRKVRMTRKNTPAIIAAAVGMMLGGAAWAQDAAGEQQSGRTRAQTESRDNSSGGQQTDQAAGGEARGERGQARGQGRGGADMQINQQLQKFAEDPSTAA